MSEIINGEECLNMKEIAKLTGWSYGTVIKYLAQDENYWTIPGHGKSKYYRKSYVEQLRQPVQVNGKEK